VKAAGPLIERLGTGRSVTMARSRRRSRGVTGEVADLTGRSDAEVKLVVGAALIGAGLAAAIRTTKYVVDLGPPLRPPVVHH
jgi:hypothetical protein